MADLWINLDEALKFYSYDSLMDAEDKAWVTSIRRYLKSVAVEVPNAEPKKGKWTKITEYDEDVGMVVTFSCCSCCNMSAWRDYDYCPNCGADMRGGSDA